jgi:hypothetical protein
VISEIKELIDKGKLRAEKERNIKKEVENLLESKKNATGVGLITREKIYMVNTKFVFIETYKKKCLSNNFSTPS